MKPNSGITSKESAYIFPLKEPKASEILRESATEVIPIEPNTAVTLSSFKAETTSEVTSIKFIPKGSSLESTINDTPKEVSSQAKLQEPVTKAVSIKTIAEVISDEQVSHFLNDLAHNPTVNLKIRKITQKVEQVTFADIPVKLKWPRNHFIVILFAQISINILILLSFHALAYPALQLLYGRLLYANIFTWLDQLGISLDLALFLAIPFYVFDLLCYLRNTLLPSEKLRVIRLVVMTMILLYCVSFTLIFVIAHIFSILNLQSILGFDDLFLINHAAVLPLLLYLGILYHLILQKFMKIAPFRTFTMLFASKLGWIIIIVSLLIPLWVTSTLIVCFIVLFISLLHMLIRRNSNLA